MSAPALVARSTRSASLVGAPQKERVAKRRTIRKIALALGIPVAVVLLYGASMARHGWSLEDVGSWGRELLAGPFKPFVGRYF